MCAQIQLFSYNKVIEKLAEEILNSLKKNLRGYLNHLHYLFELLAPGGGLEFVIHISMNMS